LRNIPEAAIADDAWMELMTRAVSLGCTYNISAYDATYLALAESYIFRC